MVSYSRKPVRPRAATPKSGPVKGRTLRGKSAARPAASASTAPRLGRSKPTSMPQATPVPTAKPTKTMPNMMSRKLANQNQSAPTPGLSLKKYGR